MSVTKQVIINCIYVIPLEVLDIVKSFCFYDVKTAAALNFHKKNMTNVVHELERSYAKSDKQWLQNSYLWLFSNNSVQLQAVTCGSCGNYRTSSSFLSRVVFDDNEFIDLSDASANNAHSFKNIIDTKMRAMMPCRMRCNNCYE